MDKAEKHYFGGWDINFEDQEQLTRFLVTHAVDKRGFKFFNEVQGGISADISNGVIQKIYRHDSFDKELIGENIELSVSTWMEHEVFFLSKHDTGSHKIGGEKPISFEMPTCEKLKTKFQYIGSINGSDKAFRWLGIPELHIAFPIYECNFGIYLDYSDAFKPRVLNPETFSDAWYDTGMDGSAEVVFKETTYKVSKKFDVEEYTESDNLLLCGVPLWYQEPAIPVCPKTGTLMRYVCTINSDSEIEVVNKEASKGLPFADECLCFGDWGHLFVFYSPESKIMHLNIQF